MAKPSRCGRLKLDEIVVGLGAAIAEELPRIPNLANLVEIQLGRDELGLVAGCGWGKLAARVAEVALSVELADVPRLLMPYAVDGPHEVGIRNRMRRLLELP